MTVDGAPTSPGLFELRFYTMRPGRRDEFAAFMDAVVIPYNIKHGAGVVASLIDEEHDDIYIWIRRFDDEHDREQRYRAIYQNPEWIDKIRPVVLELMIEEKAVVTRTLPTPGSPLR